MERELAEPYEYIHRLIWNTFLQEIKMPDYKKSIASFERYCNDKVVKADKFMADHQAAQSMPSILLNQAKDMIPSLNQQLSKLKSKWEDEVESKVEGADYDELEGRVSDMQAKVEKCMETLTQFLIRFDTNVAAAAPKVHKLDSSFKPKPELTTSNTLEEFGKWHRSFVSYHKVNQVYLEAASREIKRQFLYDCIDSRLQNAMITDDTLEEDTPIMGEAGSLLAWLKDYLLRDLPMFIRRYNFAKCKQKPGERFDDWWTRKKMKAEECDLHKIKKEDILVTELICGINNQELRKEILKSGKEPKLEELVALGRNFDTAAKIQKDNFNEDTKANRTTSEYKKSKNNTYDQRGRDSRGQSRSSDSKCKRCGKAPCDAVKHGLSSCPATDRECKSCGIKGHYKSVCKKRSPTPGPNQNAKADSKNVKCSTARCGRVKIIEAEDDNEPTPMCQMTFETEKGRKFSSEVLPDTGCSQ